MKSYAKEFTFGFETKEITTFQAFSEVLTNNVWSPIIFSDGHRHQASFVEVRLGVLDFDDGEYRLAQALIDWCDTIHVIGLSKSHQREKSGKPACDRFRLIFPYEKDIRDLRTYNYNYELLAKRYGADPVTKDGARLFFPCTEIISVMKEGFYQPIITAPPRKEISPLAAEFAKRRYQKRGALPPWLVPFLRKGVLHAGMGRNDTVLRVARGLRKLGNSEEEIFALVKEAPINWQDFDDSEVRRTIANVFKREV